MNGTNGKILWVELSSGSTREEKVPDDVYKHWLGGYGLGIYYIFKQAKKGCDPLGPGNCLAFCPGLLTGSVAPLSGRSFVCGKSPKTGGWNDSSIGGFPGMAVKRSWYDAVLVHGTSPDPVYLHLGDEGAELLDATSMWGLNTRETQHALQETHGRKARAYAIGKAGELVSPIAGIASGYRIAARGGMGAVMGAKHLKAVCMSGTRKVTYHDGQRLVNLAKAYNARVNNNSKNLVAKLATKIAPSTGGMVRVLNLPMAQNHAIGSRVFKLWGTPFATHVQVAIGDTPVQNFKGIGHKAFPIKIAQSFTTEAMEPWITGKQGCFACPVQCGHVMNVAGLGLQDTQRPEYETLAAFGPLLLNQDVETVFQANELLNLAGMDSISAGVGIAFAMECCERGILTANDFQCDAFPNGFLPSWNMASTILPLLRMMINREGIGDLLAKGVEEAARVIGKGAGELAMSINGQEVPMHDPRKTKGLITTYIADPTPARHTAASLDFQGLGEINKFVNGVKFDMSKTGRLDGAQHARFAQFMQSCNALGLCEFTAYFETYPILEIIEAVTGMQLTTEDLFITGHRIQVMRQLFNAREGAIRFDVPARMLGNPAFTSGPLKGVILRPREMILKYFETMGFTPDGVPTRETLLRLGLDEFTASLAGARGATAPAFD